MSSLGFDPATTPPLGDFDVERLAAAAKTLDPEAECPDTLVPESLEDVVEVLRIEGGCDVIEYVQLKGRNVQEVRAELFASDQTVHAVGLPPRDLVPFALQRSLYDGPPPGPYDQDDYGEGEWWHLAVLDADRLWEADGWRYASSEGLRVLDVPGWGDGDAVVAVIDSGTTEHRDLRHSLMLTDGCHYNDTRGHGTPVAGLIAAEQGNGQDVAGIAPKARILPIFLSGLVRGDETGGCKNISATKAIKMARPYADVINMSWGWTCDEVDSAGRCQPGYDTFEAQLRLAQLADIISVAAVGNCGDAPHFATVKCPSGRNGLSFPSAFPGVLGVAATDRDNQRAVFSNSNEAVDIAAPGDSILSTLPGDTVGVKSGTSFAAPLVSGVVAHMKARYPRASHGQIVTALLDTADPLGPRNHTDYGHGVIQPKAALEALDQVFNSPPKTVSAGGVHACLLTTSGIIECWGQISQSDVPSGEFSAVSAGGQHACGLKTGGTIECWGNVRSRDVPSGRHTAVSAGGSHSCAVSVSEDDPFRCWGSNSAGQLGSAVLPSGGLWWGFSAVSAGADHSCGLKTDGTIECWGGRGLGESDAPSGRFTAVSAGALHSCGLKTDGAIECWGWERDGQTVAAVGEVHGCVRRRRSFLRAQDERHHRMLGK